MLKCFCLAREPNSGSPFLFAIIARKRVMDLPADGSLARHKRRPLCGHFAFWRSGMKLIQLTRDQVTIVDDSDYEALARHKWRASHPVFKPGED